MTCLLFAMVLVCYLVAVKAGPKNLADFQSIASAGTTFDFSGSWWTDQITANYEPKSNRLQVQEAVLFQGENNLLKSVTILHAQVFDNVTYRVGNVQRKKEDETTVYSFALQQWKLINWNCSSKVMRNVSSGSMSLNVKVEHWIRTIGNLDLEVVSFRDKTFGFRMNRRKFFGAMNEDNLNIDADLKIESNVVIGSTVPAHIGPNLKISFQNMIYFYFQLTDKMKTSKLDLPEQIEVTVNYGEDSSEAHIIGSIVTVYSPNKTSQTYIQVTMSREDASLNPTYEVSEVGVPHYTTLVGKSKHWIFLSIDKQ